MADIWIVESTHEYSGIESSSNLTSTKTDEMTWLQLQAFVRREFRPLPPDVNGITGIIISARRKEDGQKGVQEEV